MDITRIIAASVLGLTLTIGGCASYEEAVKPFVDQYAAEGCLQEVEKSVKCRKIQLEMQQVRNKYGSTGGRSGLSFMYIMNQP